MDFDATHKMCSFCGKQGSNDSRLAGGLGAMICGDCIDYFHEVWASPELTAAKSRPVWDEMSDTELLAALPLILKSADQATRFAGEWVELLRTRNVSWAEIGKALGVSRQAAWERFGSKPARKRGATA